MELGRLAEPWLESPWVCSWIESGVGSSGPFGATASHAAASWAFEGRTPVRSKQESASEATPHASTTPTRVNAMRLTPLRRLRPCGLGRRVLGGTKTPSRQRVVPTRTGYARGHPLRTRPFEQPPLT